MRWLLPRIVESLIQDEVDDAAGPYVVCLQDPYLDTTTVYGPFDDAVSALTFADRQVEELLYEGFVEPATAHVKPLRPA